MSKSRQQIGAALVLTLSIAVAVFAAVRSGLTDELAPRVNDLLNSGRTEYSSGYSEREFLRLRVGMTEEEVRKKLGAPLEEFDIPAEPGVRGWKYSRTPNDSSYNVRVVHFREGIVIAILHRYYVD